ncbi:MAG: MBL fold metallo-hydrolase [Pseudomonadota bacterium]|nr:MBL fold metallo-hydrolase [Pseudomonadota bacterium]
MKITLLGCGSSQGVPVIGNRWGTCDPNNIKNRRSRPSILIQDTTINILIDMSPDVRTQLLDNNIDSIDKVLFTHQHYDHIGGIGELRTLSFLQNRRIDLYGTRPVLDILRKNWGYLFNATSTDEYGLYKPAAEPHEFTHGASFTVGDLNVIPFSQDHGICETTGFRIGDFAYSTDVVHLSDESLSILAGVKVWIVDCLRNEPHPTHAHFDRTIKWIEYIKPDHAILTHMNFESDYETIRSKCPKGVEPGYDGMILNLI